MLITTICTHTHTHTPISPVMTWVIITHSFIASWGCRCLSTIIHLQAFNHWSPHWFVPFKPSFSEISPAVLSVVTVRDRYVPEAVIKDIIPHVKGWWGDTRSSHNLEGLVARIVLINNMEYWNTIKYNSGWMFICTHCSDSDEWHTAVWKWWCCM